MYGKYSVISVVTKINTKWHNWYLITASGKRRLWLC